MGAEKKARMHICKGVVETVDADAGKITVKEHNGTMMVMPIGAGVKIMKNSKMIPITDVMAGEMVHIMYEGDMPNPMVKSVKVEKNHMKKWGKCTCLHQVC